MNAFPDLAHVLEEHLADQGGELLEYIFLADVERWAEGTLASNTAGVASLLTWLDQEYSGGDAQVQNLLAVSFVELLPRSPEPAAELRLMLGRALTFVAQEMGD